MPVKLKRMDANNEEGNLTIKEDLEKRVFKCIRDSIKTNNLNSKILNENFDLRDEIEILKLKCEYYENFVEKSKTSEILNIRLKNLNEILNNRNNRYLDLIICMITVYVVSAFILLVY